MTGDRSWLSFGLIYSIRSQLLNHPLLTVLTIFSISISVALAVSMQMSAASIRTQLENTAEALQGAAQLQLRSGKIGLPETFIDELLDQPGVRFAAPLIDANIRIIERDTPGQAVHVLGVDLLVDQEIRNYSALRDQLQVSDPLRLIATSNSVIITYRLAEQLGVKEGDSFEAMTSKGRQTLVVRGVLLKGGISEAFGAQLAIMDVYSLQTILGQEGTVDRIDIVLTSDSDEAAVREDLQKRFQGRATVGIPDTRDRFIESVMSTLMVVTNVLATTGSIAAILVALGAALVSIQRRQKSFALLRIVGLRRQQMVRIVFADSLVMGALGTLIGLPLSLLLSKTVFQLYARVATQYGANVAPELEFSTTSLILGSCIGIGVSIISAISPAKKAQQQQPLNIFALNHTEPIVPGSIQSKLKLFSAFACGLTWIGLTVPSFDGWTVTQTSLVFITGLASLILIYDIWSEKSAQTIGRAFENIVGGIGWFVAGSIRSRAGQIRMTVGAITGVIASAMMILILMSSLAITIDSNYLGRDSFVIRYGNLLESFQLNLIPDSVIEEIVQLESVKAVFRHYSTTTTFQGQEFSLSAGDYETLGKLDCFSIIEGPDCVTIGEKIRDGGIVVDQAFSRYFDIKQEDTVTISSPSGPVTFPVVGIVERYMFGKTGSARIHIDIFDKYWDRSGSTNFLIWPSSSAEDTIDQINRSIETEHPLFFTLPDEVQNSTRNLVFETTHLLYVLMALTSILGGIAILNLLTGITANQRRQLALLQAAGTAGHQIVRGTAFLGGFVSL